MLAALALSVALQAQPQVTLKPLWKRMAEGSVGDQRYRMSNRIYQVGPSTLRFMSERPGTSSTPNSLCELDIQTGQLTLLGDFPAGYGVWPNGALCQQLILSGPTLRLVVCDPTTFNPQVVYNVDKDGLLVPDHEGSAVGLVLPKSISFNFPSLGPIGVSWDGPTARILVPLRDREYRIYKPGTLIQEGVLLSKRECEALLGNRLPDPIGNPEEGAFALRTGGEMLHVRSLFFTDDWALHKVSAEYYCYDAESSGYIVGATGKRGNGWLECLDAESGKQRWIRKDIRLGNRSALWCNGYVVLTDLAGDINSKTDPLHHEIFLLDGNTGHTILNIELPDNTMALHTVVDDVILLNSGTTYWAYSLAKT